MLFLRPPGPAKTAFILLVGVGLAVPATWIQLQMLIPGLLRPTGGVEAAISVWQYLRDLHAGHAFLAIPGLVFLGLVLLPTLKLVREDGSRGAGFLVVLGGAALLALLALPESFLAAALSGDIDGLIALTSTLLFASGLAFFVTGSSRLLALAYLCWALIAAVSFIDLTILARSEETPTDSWLDVAATHAGGASILLSMFALLEARAHQRGLRQSGIIGALLATTLCLSAAAMVIFQYRLGLGGTPRSYGELPAEAASDIYIAGAAAFTLLGATLAGLFRHFLLMRPRKSAA